MVNKTTARIAICIGLMTSVQLGLTNFANAQDADVKAEQYSALLDQIQNVKLATAQREVMLASQTSEITNLREQIEAVPATKESIRGIVTRMTAEIEKIIESDLPFRKEERYARLDSLRQKLTDKSYGDADLYRRAITLYDIEANYGYAISAYTGDHPMSPGRRMAACVEDTESATCNLSNDQKKLLAAGATLDSISDTVKDGNFVHFGRMSFIYLDLDSREGFRWSKEADAWEKLPSRDIINARRAVRIARGESAPGVVTAPIKMQAAQ